MELEFNGVHVLEQSEGTWCGGVPGSQVEVTVDTTVFTTTDLMEYHGDDGEGFPGSTCRVLIAEHTVDGARHWKLTVFDTIQEIRFTLTTAYDPQEALRTLVGRLEEMSAEYWYHNAKIHVRLHQAVSVDNWTVKPDGRLDSTNNIELLEIPREQSGNDPRST